MIAPTSLVITGFYSLGDWEGYCHINWVSPVQPVGTDPLYRVEYHRTADAVGVFTWLCDVPTKHGELFGVGVRFATAPSGGTPKSRIVDIIKVTAIDADGVSAEASTTVNTPTSLAVSHVAATNFDLVCHGEIGDVEGAVDLSWEDLTKFMRNGRITLTKYGVTSQGIKRVLYDNTFSGLSSEYGPNRIRINIELFPPGINLNDVLEWDLFHPPSQDPRAPFWVVEGDLLTLSITTFADEDPVPKIAEFTFNYRRGVSIAPYIFRFRKFTGGVVPYTDWVYVNQAYERTLAIVQDPFIPVEMEGTITYVSGMPAGLSFNSSLKKITGTPTPGQQLTQYEALFNVTSEGNKTKRQSFFLDLGSPGAAGVWPVINSPASPITLLRGSPYPESHAVIGQGTGIYGIASGTLPAGLTLDVVTGIISGTPTAIEAPHVVVFHKTSVPDTSFGPDYPVTYQVIEGLPPQIVMEAEYTIYLYELCSIPIKTNFVSFAFRGFGLPNGLSIQGDTITGVPDCPPGRWGGFVQAGNVFGWGTLFNVVLVVDVKVPVISSANSIAAIINENFFYQIIASNEPVFFGADGLPDGLDYNAYTGVISGVPTGLSSSYHLTNPETFKTGDKQEFTLAHTVRISAVNRAGAGTMDLTIDVKLPEVPVIDTSALNGRAISLGLNEIFTFQPSASNHPTRWNAEPLPQGLSFDSVSGRLTGQFLSNGFYGITFVASNAGGDSEPVTFYFIVGEPIDPTEPPPPISRVPIDVVDLWVDIDTGSVSVGAAAQSDVDMTVKRGDSTIVNIIFHKEGVPQNINLTALYFGGKTTFDEKYVVFSDLFTRTGDGRYKTYPDFSDQNNELDSIMVPSQAELIGEIQWDTSDVTTGEKTRRSTQTFPIIVLRDLLHPDPAL